MSDKVFDVPSAAATEVSAGTLLRQAREASGLHVAALAVSMKVPVKKLEALEADRLEELTDAVFIRALAASVCRTLKIDPAPVLSRLPQSVTPRLNSSDRGVSMPAQGSNFLASHSVGHFASKPSVLLVALLLLAALAIALFPEARNTVGLNDSAKQVLSSMPAVAPPASDAVPAAIPVVAAKAPVAQPIPQASADLAAAVPEAVKAPADLPAKPASSAVTVSPDAAPAAAGLLVFKAKSRAWIRVSDSKGVVQFEKTLGPGETAAATGVLPLSVVVGNVAATEVVLRGQAFPLETLTQNNVARFEVK